MQLKSLNCKNCGSPLREVNGKLHCSVCGGIFDIETSFENQKMEQIQRSLENSEAAIEADKRALEEFQRVKEAAEIEAERQKRERWEAELRPIRHRAKMHMIRTLVITLVGCAVAVGLIFLAIKSTEGTGKSKKSNKTAAQTTEEKNYRITPAELKGAGAFVEELTEKAVETVRKEHEGSVFESTNDTLYIWNLSADPYVMNYYLLTRDDGNYLYMLMAIPMTGKNNAPNSDEVLDKEMYVMAYVEDVAIGSDGTVTYYNDRIRTDGSSDYSFFWHADAETGKMIEELITAKETDPEKPYVLHEFTL